MKLCHVTISVKNMEDSLHFYRDIIGLSEKRNISAGNVEIVFLGDGETEIELIYNQENKNISIGQDISLGFEVNSIDETIGYLQQQGIGTSKVFEPSPQTKFFFVSDPDGVKVQFIEYVK